MILLTVLAIWIFSLCLHEFAHARVAYSGGDHTVADKGYLSFNPLKYMNPMMSIVLPAIFLLLGGIALPGGAVWIEQWRLRSRGWRSAVSLAGPAMNLFMCALLGLPFLFGMHKAGLSPEELAGPRPAMWAILAVSCYFQAFAAVLNLLPVPGLDGYGAIEPWLPRQAQEWGTRFKRYGFFILLILLIASPDFNRWFGGVVGHIVMGVLRVEPRSIQAGLDGIRLLSL